MYTNADELTRRLRNSVERYPLHPSRSAGRRLQRRAVIQTPLDVLLHAVDMMTLTRACSVLRAEKFVCSFAPSIEQSGGLKSILMVKTEKRSATKYFPVERRKRVASYAPATRRRGVQFQRLLRRSLCTMPSSLCPKPRYDSKAMSSKSIFMPRSS